ncbi:MAG: LamG-like jellyroll fold domain-containing protein, partial [Rhodospirillaceae bacterium]
TPPGPGPTGPGTTPGTTPAAPASPFNPATTAGDTPPPAPPTVADLPAVTPTPPPAVLALPTPPAPTPPPVVVPTMVASTSGALTGVLTDGPIKGARVFVDANDNGVYDSGEYSVITDATGHFTIAADKLALGRLRSVYSADAPGIDTETGLPFKVAMTAPKGETNLTGITSLIAAVMDKNPGLTKAQAAQKVATAIGAPHTVDLLSFDPSTAANAGSALSKVATNLLVIVSGVAATLTGSGAAASDATAMSKVLGALANQVTALAPGQTLSLSGAGLTTGIAQVMAGSLTAFGKTTTAGALLADATNGKIVNIISGLVDAVSNAASNDDVNAVAKTALGEASTTLNTIAQNQAAALAHPSAAASLNLESSLSYAIGKYTGDNLAATLDTTKTEIATNQGHLTVQQAPVVVADLASTRQTTSITISVLANDSDPQGQPDSLTLINLVHLDTPSVTTRGTITIGADGKTVLYDPGTAFNYLAFGQTTSDSFAYVVGNGTGQTTTGTVKVTITGTNHAPVLTLPAALAIADTAAADSFTSRTGALAASDADEADSLSYTLSGGSAVTYRAGGISYGLEKAGRFGTLYLSTGSGEYVYVPDSATINALAGTDSGSDSFTVTVSDGKLTSSKTLTVDISGANDTPTLSGPASVSGNEDTRISLAGIQVADVDTGTGTFRVSLSVGHGSLTLGSLSGLSFVSGDGTSDAAMSFNGTLAAVNAALATLGYQGSADYFGSDSLAVTVNDLGLSASSSTGITVAAVQDAPVLNPTGAAALSAVNAGTAVPVGDSVSSLIATGWISDVDLASPVKAIAITAVESSVGSWQYSLDSGAHWTAISTASLSQGQVLELGPGALLGLVPISNGQVTWSGATRLTYRAWDQSDNHASGDYVSGATTGGASALSAGTGTMVATVTPTPAGFPATQTFGSASPAGWIITGSPTYTLVTNGSLQLTDTGTGQFGSAYYDTETSLQYGLHLSFKFYSGDGNGADGISCYLFDGHTAPGHGASGGALGYGGSGLNNGVYATPGVAEAYMGLAFDTWGNFLAQSQWGGNGLADPANYAGNTPYYHDYVSIRGHSNATGTTGYQYLDGSAVGVAGYGGINGDWRAVDLTIGTDQRLTLKMNFEDGNGWRTLLSNYDLAGHNGNYQPPSGTVKIGFAASTGGSTDTHLIDDVSISTLTSAGLPVACDDHALALNGSTHVDIAATAALQPTAALTLEAWVQLSAAGGTLFDTLSGSAGYQLGIDGAGHLRFTVGNGSTATITSTGASIADGAWHHVAASYDGATERLFIDGAANGSGGAAGLLGQSPGSTLTLGSGLTGTVNDVSLWSTARSQSQIAIDRTHSLTGTESGLAGYWKFDEPGGGTAYGSAAGSPNGTIVNAAGHPDLGTTIEVAAAATQYKGMILGFDGNGDALSYTPTNSGATSHGSVVFSGNAFVYTPTSGHVSQDDSFTVSIADQHSHTVTHEVQLHHV